MSTEIVLFHHAQGLLPGVKWFADRLRDRGHKVHTPDFYGGRTFGKLEKGVGYRDKLGQEELMRRAHAAVADLPADVVYAGFSLGVALAQGLAQTRPGAKGAFFLHGVLPVDAFGSWPQGLPAQVHTMADDPWVDLEEATTVANLMQAEIFVYPGNGHLFADPDLPDYDEAATKLVLERVGTFLKGL